MTKKPDVKVVFDGRINAGGTVVLDGNMLPAEARNMHLKIGDVDYVISFETIKCKLRELHGEFEKLTVEDQLKEISNAIGEQVTEFGDFVEKKKIKENVILGIYDFLTEYFRLFINNVMNC